VKRLVHTLGAVTLMLGIAAVAVAQPPAKTAAAPSGSAPSGSASATASAKATATATAKATATATAKATAAPATTGPALTGSGPTASTATAPATAGSAGAPAAPSTATQPTTAMDGQTYQVRLRDLEQKIDELKEQIRRSHTRLSLLSDTILSGGGSGSRAVVRFKNDLSDAFRVTRALFVLDGAVQYNKTDQSGALSDQDEIPIFNGSIPPGDHTLQVLINLQGNGYGVFSYLRGYKFEVRSSHSFSAVEGKTINVDAIAYEKGSVTTPLEERPGIRYLEKVISGLADPGAAAPGAVAQPVQPSP